MTSRIFKRFLTILCSLLFLVCCSCLVKPSAQKNESTIIAQTPQYEEQATSSPFVSITSEKESPTPTTMNVSPLYDDYTFLWQALETDYPYLSYLKQKGVNVDRIRERYAKQMEQVYDPDQFLTVLDKMFKELNNTAHLGTINPFLYHEYYLPYVLDPTVSSYAPAAIFRKALQNPDLSDIYTPPTSYDEVAEEYIGLFPSPNVSYYEDCKTVCFTIKTFLYETVARDRDLVTETMSKYPDAENIIFNIIGNGGGSDAYWIENLVEPFEGDNCFTWREFYRDTPLNREYIESYAEESFPVSEADDVPDWAKELGFDRYICSSLHIKGKGLVQSSAKRWVLVNGKVYSASEKFVCFCKATGWATVAGTKTLGDGLGTTPILLLLPKSGILVRFNNTAGETPDGGMTIEGTTPDIVFPSAGILSLMNIIRKGGTE